jgi:hypothetical protein
MGSPRVGRARPPAHQGIYTHLRPYINRIDKPYPTMETTEKNPSNMTRTEYVIANITGVKTPLEFKTAEKLASKRLSELEAIVKGISTKWIKGRHDTEMLAQTKGEMDRITQALSDKRAKFGRVV